MGPMASLFFRFRLQNRVGSDADVKAPFVNEHYAYLYLGFRTTIFEPPPSLT